MDRVRDPVKSIEFYTKLFGMSLITRKDFPEAKFSLYFLGHNVPPLATEEERARYAFSVPGVLELTHNHGTEVDSAFEGYKSGNEPEHRGYGHIGITVDNVEALCEKLDGAGCRFIKRPNEGRMKSIAFVTDPDGYWIELIPKGF
ncbi:glyoxalase I [Blyttiomyces helicus]|uniref:lactoylglutathione lyase n=1 Tax=Blyttiomyces helicus TaxID=388810 RepID=A0A4V1IRI2_9FUNG|nr:glyoxalase I [Blyttiomyces helicus]|eukprot:RKO90147.1 glyoxalase I [Blyttiomyces helicus]